MAAFTKVATRSDIPAGTGKAVDAAGKAIAVFNCAGTFYAIENTCKHRGGPLAEGMLSGTTISCPWHGWPYDVTTGVCEMNPSVKQQTFEVRVEGEDIFVAV